jgi:predicted kinase
MVKTLILMVGLPRSGKSTRAAELSKEHGAPIVNPDSIHKVVHGTAYRDEANPIVWGVAKTMVRALFEAGHDTVIVDACNNTKHRRQEWKDWSGKIWERRYEVVAASAGTCLSRLDMTNQQLAPVIQRMNTQHERVNHKEETP